MDYYTQFIQAAVGTTSHLAGLLKGWISGLASDPKTGLPLAGVVVTAQRTTGQTWSVTTADNGSYSIELPSGNYSITASLPGYAEFLSEIEIPPDQSVQLDLPLQICQPPQEVDFSFVPAEPWAGEMTTFSASVTGPLAQLVDYDWDFGDKHFASGQIVTHIYTRSQIYPVTLTATTCGGSGTARHDVLIVLAPVSIYLPLLSGNQP